LTRLLTGNLYKQPNATTDLRAPDEEPKGTKTPFMELMKENAISSLLSYLGNDQVLIDFSVVILQWYERYLVLKISEEIPNTRVTINNSENVSNMFISEVIFELKPTERTRESIVHELLHLELRMNRIPIEIGIGEKNEYQNDLMGFLPNHIEHSMILEKYLALGLEKEKFVTKSPIPDINSLKTANEFYLQYLSLIDFETIFSTSALITSYKSLIREKCSQLTGQDQSSVFTEFDSMHELKKSLNFNGYTNLINRFFEIWGFRRFTNCILFEGRDKVKVMNI
jgi:hypothetical protein